MERQRLTQETLDSEAFVESFKELYKAYPNHIKSWFDNCNLRLYDVEFIEVDKKRNSIYHVHKNERLGDTYRGKYYQVKTLGMWAWCQCSFKKWGASRQRRGCSHIGAVRLFELYYQYLEDKK